MTSAPVPVSTPDGDMPAHLWLPEAGSGPGILLLQEIFGVSRYIEQRARDLAGLGYVVLVPELFWRLGVSRVEEGPEALEEALALLQRADWQAAVRDSLVALEQLGARSEVVGGVGIVGFCFGGGLGFSVAAESSPDVLVSYYGSALPDILGLVEPDAPVTVVEPGAVTAPSLHHFGLADRFLTPQVVEQVRDALEPLEQVTFHGYETADHAFDNPDFFLHDAEASRLSWERTAAWLAQHLPVDSVARSGAPAPPVAARDDGQRGAAETAGEQVGRHASGTGRPPRGGTCPCGPGRAGRRCPYDASPTAVDSCRTVGQPDAPRRGQPDGRVRARREHGVAAAGGPDREHDATELPGEDAGRAPGAGGDPAPVRRDARGDGG